MAFRPQCFLKNTLEDSSRLYLHSSSGLRLVSVTLTRPKSLQSPWKQSQDSDTAVGEQRRHLRCPKSPTRWDLVAASTASKTEKSRSQVMLTKSVNIKLGTENLSGLTATTTWAYFKLKEKQKRDKHAPKSIYTPRNQRLQWCYTGTGGVGDKNPEVLHKTTVIISGTQISPQPQGQWLQWPCDPVPTPCSAHRGCPGCSSSIWDLPKICPSCSEVPGIHLLLNK